MKARAPRRWRRGVAVLALLAVIALGGWVAWLDQQVQNAFEGRRWALPAQVYARPLTLYPGAPVSREALEAHLEAVGYRRAAGIPRPGTFERLGSGLRLHTRAFAFWDGVDAPRRVALAWSGGRLARVSVQGEPEAPGVRIEPRHIGGIFPAAREDRLLVRLQDVPPELVGALVAVEDREFFRHHGVRPLAIARAAWANLRAGRVVQGGSTLTQQLVKNFYLDRRRTLGRKLKEAVMALLLEAHYDKPAILEAYLNEIYLGQDGARAIHGFGLAARFYFGRDLADLDPARIALLVALVKGPSYYDPRRHPQRARARRDWVIERMRADGLIDDHQALVARNAPLGVVARPRRGLTPYPAFVDLVRRQLRRDYRESDLTGEGLRIFTTLDPAVQAAAEAGVREGLAAVDPQGRLQAALLVSDRATGEVLAVVGGRDPRYPGFNRALDARRPVGSLIKPALYLAALGSGYTLATPLRDVPLPPAEAKAVGWSPRNYDGRAHGDVPLYRALAHSYNLATVRLGMALGVGRLVETLRRLGVHRELPAYPALFLGAANLSPLEVLQMYQTLAAEGFPTPPKAVLGVTDRAGRPLARYPLAVGEPLEADAVFLVTHALQAVVREGTGRALARWLDPSLAVAGKTGTSNDGRDAWFAGFTGGKVAVAWVGGDDNQATGLTGARHALPLWGRTLAALHPQPLEPVPPPGVEWVWVDPASGLRADRRCRERVRLPFAQGTAPGDYAPCAGGARPALWRRGWNWLRERLP